MCFCLGGWPDNVRGPCEGHGYMHQALQPTTTSSGDLGALNMSSDFWFELEHVVP